MRTKWKAFCFVFFIQYSLSVNGQNLTNPEVEKTYPYFLGLGGGLILLDAPDSKGSQTQGSFGASGNIPMSIGGLLKKKHLIKAVYYFEDYFPSVTTDFQYQIGNSFVTVELSSLIIRSSTFGISYGLKIPFTVFKNDFSLYPKAGILVSIFDKVEQIGISNYLLNLPNQPIPQDTLIVHSRRISQPNKTNYHLSIGSEIETKVFVPRMSLVFDIAYNFSIQESATGTVEFSLVNARQDFNEEIGYRLDHLNLSLGLRYYFNDF